LASTPAPNGRAAVGTGNPRVSRSPVAPQLSPHPDDLEILQPGDDSPQSPPGSSGWKRAASPAAAAAGGSEHPSAKRMRVRGDAAAGGDEAMQQDDVRDQWERQQRAPPPAAPATEAGAAAAAAAAPQLPVTLIRAAATRSGTAPLLSPRSPTAAPAAAAVAAAAAAAGASPTQAPATLLTHADFGPWLEGRRLLVKWPEGGRWDSGIVHALNVRTGRATIVYIAGALVPVPGLWRWLWGFTACGSCLTCSLSRDELLACLISSNPSSQPHPDPSSTYPSTPTAQELEELDLRAAILAKQLAWAPGQQPSQHTQHAQHAQNAQHANHMGSLAAAAAPLHPVPAANGAAAAAEAAVNPRDPRARSRANGGRRAAAGDGSFLQGTAAAHVPPPGHVLLAVESIDESLVGARLQLLWPEDKQWYPGFVLEVDAGSGKAVVEYDYGGARWA